MVNEQLAIVGRCTNATCTLYWKRSAISIFLASELTSTDDDADDLENLSTTISHGPRGALGRGA